MSAIAAWAAVMIGYDSAFIGGTLALVSFKNEFGLTGKPATELAFLSSNIVSTYQGGCFFGALAGYPLGWFFGRRIGLMVTAAVFCLGAGLMLGADGERGLGLIYAGRIIAGLAIGAASNLTPMYIAEIAPTAIRGRLVGLYELGWQIGGIIGFWINYAVNLHIKNPRAQWLWPFGVQLIPGGLFLMGALFLKESPRWLLSKGRDDQALKNLAWIRSLPEDHPYVQQEIASMHAVLTLEKETTGEDFFAPFRAVFKNKVMFKRMCITSLLFAWQNGTGINAINYYSPTIFRSLGITGTSTGLLTTGVFGVIKTIGALIWLIYLIDNWGRRPLLITGAIGGAFSMLGIAIYIAIENPAAKAAAITAAGGKPTLGAGGRTSIALFYIWTIFYAATWNGTPWVVNSEVFPGSVRALTSMVAAASNWLYNFAISRATPYMFLEMGTGGWGVYLFFSLMMIASIAYVWFLLPETKHVPLDMMSRLFDEGLPVRHANKIVMEEVRSRHFGNGFVTGQDVEEKAIVGQIEKGEL